MLGKRRWFAILTIAAMVTAGLGLTAGADSATESEFLAKINAERSANGLGGLSMDGGLQAHARRHTQDMMDANQIYHSTSAELQAAAGSGWSKLGENVGRGGSVDSLHQAFMNSSGHRANILGDYNYAGIGTGTKDGVLYVTVVFMKKGSTTTTTTAPPQPGTTMPPPKPTTTAAPTTTTTTLPPTTTTTLIVGPDKPIVPGNACIEATLFWWMCHD